MPVMPDEFANVVTDRYVELYEKITGLPFEKGDNTNINKRIESNVAKFLMEKGLY
jgi:phosphoribosylaminoimidazole-succinocarboxamide synthase